MTILYDIYKFLLVNANFALFIATLLLVIVTFLYVIHTKKMADMMVKQAEETSKMAEIMVKEYELKISPIIELKLERITPCEIDVRLFNRGMIPVNLEKIIFKWWYKHKEDKTWTKELNVDKDKSLIKEEPKEFNMRYFPDDFKKDEFPDSKNMSDGDLFGSIEGEIYACYKNIKDEMQTTRPVKIERLL